jgi:hypothetical protein
MSESAPASIVLSVTGAVATSSKAAVRMPHAGTIRSITTAVTTAPTGAALVCDVNVAGTTVFTTQANRPSIAATEFSDNSAAVQAGTFAAGDVISVDVDQVGSTIAGANLSVLVTYDMVAADSGDNVYDVATLRGDHPGGVQA